MLYTGTYRYIGVYCEEEEEEEEEEEVLLLFTWPISHPSHQVRL